MCAARKILDASDSKVYRGFTNLTIGFHEVECFRFVKNKYAKDDDPLPNSVLVELKDEVLFLPKHFSRRFSEDDLNELNTIISEKGEKVYLYFGGRNPNGYV